MKSTSSKIVALFTGILIKTKQLTAVFALLQLKEGKKTTMVHYFVFTTISVRNTIFLHTLIVNSIFYLTVYTVYANKQY